MGQFSYSLCLSLFHSLWQAALLLFIYSAFHGIIKKQLPSVKRNVLYLLVLTQVIISGFTFYIYYTGALEFYQEVFEAKMNALFIKQPFLERAAPWIIGTYTFILSLKAIRLIYNWQRFKQTCSSSLIKPPVDIRLFSFVKANEFGIRRKVTVWFSTAISTPLTFGFLKPVILMPVALINQLTIAETESLIIHELTHIRNNDYILNWLLIIAENIFFFNPFIKIISNKIKLEREKNCDVQVLSFKYPVINYAETLLKAAKFKSTTNIFQLAAVFKNKQLLQRIHFFTKERNLLFNKKNYGVVPSSLILAALFINVFVLSVIINYMNYQKADTATVLMNAVREKKSPEIIPAFATTQKLPAVIELQYEDAVAEDQRASSDKHLRKIKTHLTKLTEQAIDTEIADIEENLAENNYAVAAAEIQSDDTKDVILKEENSATGQIVTKAYQVKWKDGQWVPELLWMLTETRPNLDNINNCRDSSILNYIPLLQ